MSRIFQREWTTKVPKGAVIEQGPQGPRVRIKQRGRLVWCPLDAKGRVVRTAPCYTIEWIDSQGTRQQEKAFNDAEASQALLTRRLREAERERAGLITPSERLAARPLTEWLDEWERVVRASDVTVKHANTQLARARASVAFAEWRTFAMIEPESLVVALAERGESEARFGATTRYHYLGAAKAFARWLAGKLKVADPLAALRRALDPRDVRVNRRALSEAEFGRLIEATTNAATRYGLPGPLRAALYLAAAGTGLRCSELASLTPRSLALTASPPTVTVEARYSKRRRRDVVPLPSTLAPVLAALAEGLASTAPLWPVGSPAWVERPTQEGHGAKMVAEDLRTAGLAVLDELGRVFDFHALRSQYATDLARAGVSLTNAQRLLRHCRPELTANHYTRADLGELGRDADRLQRGMG